MLESPKESRGAWRRPREPKDPCTRHPQLPFSHTCGRAMRLLSSFATDDVGAWPRSTVRSLTRPEAEAMNRQSRVRVVRKCLQSGCSETLPRGVGRRVPIGCPARNRTSRLRPRKRPAMQAFEERLKGFEPSTFCMASRRAGQSAPLRERQNPLIAGNRSAASGWVWLRLRPRMRHGSSGRRGRLVACWATRRAVSRPSPGPVPTAV
jgi:hypothetical protein